MKNVVAFVGSARRKHTYNAVRQFMDHLRMLGEVDPEIVLLSEYRLDACRGCKRCFEEGEEACPLKDDRDVLIEKMMNADGVVFASPSYMFQVSGTMKTFIDRLAFIGHRPRFFGKPFTHVTTQGLPFGGKIGKYLHLVGSCFGFNTVRGSCLVALEPMSEKEARKADKILAKHSRRFFESLGTSALPVPTLTMLMGFRIGRTTIQEELDDRSCDYRYYRDKGWFDASYYYPVRLGLPKKILGRLFDVLGARMARARSEWHRESP